jgi:ferredoxin
MEPSGERLRANAWGPFYVTDTCDACGICASRAPDNFARSWDGTYYAVLQQPESPEEVQAMRGAMQACPRHCIHDDWDA